MEQDPTTRCYERTHKYFSFLIDYVILPAEYRFAPYEVESILIEHPASNESAFVASPDEVRDDVDNLTKDHQQQNTEKIIKEEGVPAVRKMVCGLIAFLIASCVFITESAYGKADSPKKYNLITIANEVLTEPGILSWSPDNKKIAFISRGLHIFDAETMSQRAIDIKDPFYINWAEEDELFVLYKENGHTVLCAVDTAGPKIKKIRMEIEPDAVFLLPDKYKLLLFSLKTRISKIGTEISYTLFCYDMVTEKLDSLYTFSKIYMTKIPDIRFFKAWMHAGVNPLENTLLIMEQIKPPVVMPYSRLQEVDYITGQTQEILSQKTKKLYISGSWSPNGERIALTDTNGHLEIYNRYNAGITYIDQNIQGFYPSWNPKGSQIFFGGYIIESASTNREKLFSDSVESIAYWSSDGKKIAVVTDTKLYLVDNIKPSFLPPDGPLDRELRKKISVLKDLFIEQLLDKEEYIQRYNKLLKRTGEVQ